jgi:hypothetical protein
MGASSPGCRFGRHVADAFCEEKIQHLMAVQVTQTEGVAGDGEEVVEAKGADELAAGDAGAEPGRLLAHAGVDLPRDGYRNGSTRICLFDTW